MRLEALVAVTRHHEADCGCPPDQLCRADRFTIVDENTFANEETPTRIFHLRVLTIDEAKAEADMFGDDVEEYGDSFSFNGIDWIILDA